MSREELEVIGGVPTEVVVGKLIDPSESLSTENFGRNRRFVDYMHSIVEQWAPTIEEVESRAKRIGNGKIPIYDRRSALKGLKPTERDILGWFEVEDGRILEDSYQANDEHRILDETGMFTPHPVIIEKVLESLRGLRFVDFSNESAGTNAIAKANIELDPKAPPNQSENSAGRPKDV